VLQGGLVVAKRRRLELG